MFKVVWVLKRWGRLTLNQTDHRSMQGAAVAAGRAVINKMSDNVAVWENPALCIYNKFICFLARALSLKVHISQFPVKICCFLLFCKKRRLL